YPRAIRSCPTRALPISIPLRLPLTVESSRASDPSVARRPPYDDAGAPLSAIVERRTRAFPALTRSSPPAALRYTLSRSAWTELRSEEHTSELQSRENLV